MTMTTRLQAVIEAVQELSPLEQLDLIQALSKSVQASYLGISSTKGFWNPKTLEQHIREQRPSPVSDLADLVAGFWPEDESADDLVSYIYEQRLQDRRN
jgi:hypothetical protein